MAEFIPLSRVLVNAQQLLYNEGSFMPKIESDIETIFYDHVSPELTSANI